METIESCRSPDGELELVAMRATDGTVAIGFSGGGSWHTHPDMMTSWLGVGEEECFRRLVELLSQDVIPVVMSTDSGQTIEPWISDNLDETLRLFGKENCVLRYWSGRSVDAA